MDDDETQLIQATLEQTRGWYRTNCIVEIAMMAYFVLDLRAMETSYGKIQVGLLVATALIFVGHAMTWWKARASGPVAMALLARPEEIATVTGKPKAGPRMLALATRAGARASLRVGRPAMKSVVEAIHRRAPQASIDVQNVMSTTRATAG